MVPTAMNHTGTTGSGSINPLESDNILHRILSIGCNRIEYWIYNKSIGPRSKNETSAWTHMSTTSIASTSPNALVGTTTKSPNSSIGTVCTLSSDLLCLEVCTVVTSSSSSNHRATIVAVGGVDGRIHFYWDRQNPIQYGLQHLITITAHQGRVNGLSYDETRQRLISGSHDGTIHCWSVQWNHMDHNESITIDQIASYEFNDGVRVTALLYFSSQRSNGTSMNIIAGTQVGSIHLLAITDKMESGKCEILATSDIYIDNYDGEARGNGPIINAFCHLRVKTISNTSLNTFVVAHSQCMGIIQVLGEAEDHTL
jgi:WD40 repeat protein